MAKTALRKIPIWMRLAIGVIVAIFALIAAGVVLRYWITSDAGRAFIVSQIDGRRLGPLGTIRLSGLKGDPLAAATVADIALVDDDGIWVRARDAELKWTPSKLLGGELEIQAIKIRSVDMLRMPHTTYQSERNPPPDIGLKLDSVDIDELRIADNLIGGTAASYRIAGGAARARDSSGFVKLSVAPLTGPTDKIDASGEWSASGAIKGLAVVSGPPGGVIAALTQAPTGSAVTFDASVNGTIAGFTGTARLAFADQPVAVIDLLRKGDVGHITASVAAERWPLIDVLAHRIGANLSITGEVNLADMARAPITLTLTAPAGRIDASAVADLEDMYPRGDIRIAATGLDLALLAPPLTGTVDAAGALRMMSLTDFIWRGDATATALTYPSGAVARASGPLTLRKSRSTISWDAPSITVDGGRITPLTSLAPARYAAATRGEVNLATHTVEITQAQVRGAPGDASGRGAYSIRTGAFAFSGAASFARLSDVAPLTGAARGQWTVRRASYTAPIRVTADLTGRGVSSPIRALADLAGPTPAATLSGVVHSGRFTLESGALHGAGLTATLAGRITDAGAITGHATGTLTRPLTLPAATFTSLTLAADLTGDLTSPRAAITLSDGAAIIAGLPIDNLGGQAELRLGDKIAGDFALTGGSAGQRLLAAGRIGGGGGDWRIANLSGRLGGVQVTAPQLAYADGVLSIAFDASGSLAGLGGLDRGTLAAKGKASFGKDLVLDISGQLANLKRGTLKLDLISFDADAANNRATLTGHVKGALGAPVDLAIKAEGTHAAEAWSGQASLEGSVDQLAVSTSRPARWRYGEAGWSVDTELTAFGGNLNVNLASGAQGASASLDLVGLDLRALSRLARITPLNGRVTGQASFANGPSLARGDLQLGISGASPVGVSADPVMLSISSHLRDGVVSTQVAGSGQGFKLDGDSRVRMDAGKGFNLTPNRTAPVEGHLGLSGRAEQLWALFGPEGQALRGQLETDVRLGGTLDSPALTGAFSIAEGAYEHGETGFSLRNIFAKGVLDQHSARITELTAQDNQTGRLSGSGALNWNGKIEGGVQFTASDLRALGRDDRSAVVSGKGEVSLEDEAIRVGGDFTVSQARISIEQPASAVIPTLPGVRRINFTNREDDEATPAGETPFWKRPVRLDLKVKAPRRIVVFGRGLDTEWSADLTVKGPIVNPEINGRATLIRGDLDLAGRRFAFDTGTINLDGPIKQARIDISAERSATDIDARVHVTGSPVDPKFTLESTPALPQDEILAHVLFGRSASELSAFEAAQLAAGLAQLAGGQAGFDPAGLVRKAVGLDRVALGAAGGIATVSAGKYIAEDVYLQVGAGGEGGVGAEVEWEPRDNLSITSSAQGNGDTKIAVRWKKDY